MTIHFVAAKTLGELELIVNQALKQEYCRAGSVAFLNGEYVMELCTQIPLRECTPVLGSNGQVLWAPACFKETQKQEKAAFVAEGNPGGNFQYIPMDLHKKLIGDVLIRNADFLGQLIENGLVPVGFTEELPKPKFP